MSSRATFVLFVAVLLMLVAVTYVLMTWGSDQHARTSKGKTSVVLQERWGYSKKQADAVIAQMLRDICPAKKEDFRDFVREVSGQHGERGVALLRDEIRGLCPTREAEMDAALANPV